MSNINYNLLNKQLTSLLSDQPVWYTNLSQCSALIMNSIAGINWVGFYLLTEDNHLKLGPFQGRVACMDIKVGEGVCGTVAQSREIQRIADVHQFKGHIACDARSQSEIVLPMIIENRLLGVLDIDSPDLDRFSQDDELGLSTLLKTLVNNTQWPEQF